MDDVKPSCQSSRLRGKSFDSVWKAKGFLCFISMTGGAGVLSFSKDVTNNTASSLFSSGAKLAYSDYQPETVLFQNI